MLAHGHGLYYQSVTPPLVGTGRTRSGRLLARPTTTARSRSRTTWGSSETAGSPCLGPGFLRHGASGPVGYPMKATPPRGLDLHPTQPRRRADQGWFNHRPSPPISTRSSPPGSPWYEPSSRQIHFPTGWCSPGNQTAATHRPSTAKPPRPPGVGAPTSLSPQPGHHDQPWTSIVVGEEPFDDSLRVIISLAA
jgi:hypothetical protein